MQARSAHHAVSFPAVAGTERPTCGLFPHRHRHGAPQHAVFRRPQVRTTTQRPRLRGARTMPHVPLACRLTHAPPPHSQHTAPTTQQNGLRRRKPPRAPWRRGRGRRPRDSDPFPDATRTPPCIPRSRATPWGRGRRPRDSSAISHLLMRHTRTHRPPFLPRSSSSARSAPWRHPRGGYPTRISNTHTALLPSCAAAAARDPHLGVEDVLARAAEAVPS